jgi:hypothetical protein
MRPGGRTNSRISKLGAVRQPASSLTNLHSTAENLTGKQRRSRLS